jgi:hypothetical protein
MPSRVLLATPDVTFGEFECPPADPLWDEINANIGGRPHVVFPRTRVVIAQQARLSAAEGDTLYLVAGEPPR